LNVFRSTAWPVAEAMTSSALTLATGSFHGTVTGPGVLQLSPGAGGRLPI